MFMKLVNRQHIDICWDLFRYDTCTDLNLISKELVSEQLSCGRIICKRIQIFECSKVIFHIS